MGGRSRYSTVGGDWRGTGKSMVSKKYTPVHPCISPDRTDRQSAFSMCNTHAQCNNNHVVLFQHWIDELLRWNESDYGGVKSVTLLPTRVWLPDFGITNT